jgi:hypothetical protein
MEDFMSTIEKKKIKQGSTAPVLMYASVNSTVVTHLSPGTKVDVGEAKSVNRADFRRIVSQNPLIAHKWILTSYLVPDDDNFVKTNNTAKIATKTTATNTANSPNRVAVVEADNAKKASNVTYNTTTGAVSSHPSLVEDDLYDFRDRAFEEMFERTQQAVAGFSVYSQGSTTYSGAAIPAFTGVHGLPFHFLNSTDRKKRSGDSYGRMYIKDILSKVPIVNFVPGAPHFLNGSIGLKDKAVSALYNAEGDMSDSAMSLFMESVGAKHIQYFTHRTTFEPYFKYVNTLCRSSAIMMGIGDVKYKGTALRAFRWESINKLNDDNWARSLTGLDQAVSFIYEPESNVSNSLNNQTTQSQLAGTLSGLSAKAREAEFLFGAGAGIEFQGASDEYIEQMMPKYNELAKYNPNSILGRIGQTGKLVSTGANVVYPEIWNDSDYTKDYSIDLVFRSPYSDPLSKFLHVLVPFWHLFALAGPRSVHSNAYVSPFLIRAYSKGYFDVQLGMIDGLQFKKYGDGDSLSDDMVPTVIEVSLNFKDLTKALALSSSENATLFLNNAGLIDMIGTMSGVNMNRMSMAEKYGLVLESKYRNVLDAPGNIQKKVQDSVKGAARLILGDTINR